MSLSRVIRLTIYTVDYGADAESTGQFNIFFLLFFFTT